MHHAADILLTLFIIFVAAQIGAEIAEGSIGAVIFLRDVLTSQPHEPDITALLRFCDVHNVPVATNLATAELVIQSLGR